MFKRNYSRLFIYFLIMAAGSFFFSCSKMEDLHKKYLEGGEIVYPGKIDSIHVIGGKKRVKFVGLKPTDPKVTSGKIYWNNRRDSIEFQIKEDSNPFVEVMIAPLDEGTYTFEVVTFNSMGNQSVTGEVRGKSYGDNFESSLLNRQIKDYGYASGKVTIEWYPFEETDAGVVISYKNKSGNTVEVTSSNNEAITILEDYKNGAPFTYYTNHMPEPNSLDVFKSESATIEVIPVEVQLDAGLFKVLALPGDAKPQNASHSLSRIWNGNIGPGGDYRTNNNSVIPQHYNWELGVSATLTKIIVFQRGANAEPGTTEGDLIYKLGNFELFEVWGSNDPDPDGSFNGWTMLGSFTSYKPSGLPVGELAQEDRDFAKPGEVFEFPEGLDPVKYIRINILKTWGNTKYSFTNQVDIKGFIE